MTVHNLSPRDGAHIHSAPCGGTVSFEGEANRIMERMPETWSADIDLCDTVRAWADERGRTFVPADVVRSLALEVLRDLRADPEALLDHDSPWPDNEAA